MPAKEIVSEQIKKPGIFLKSAVGLGKASYGAAKGLGSAAFGAAEIGGGAALKTAGLAAKTAPIVAGMGLRAGAGLAATSSSLIKADPKGFMGVTMSGVGKGIFVGGSLLAGAKQGLDTFNTNRMGQRDGQVTTATPQTPKYNMLDDAGATGDLVFDLHKNKNR